MQYLYISHNISVDLLQISVEFDRFRRNCRVSNEYFVAISTLNYKKTVMISERLTSGPSTENLEYLFKSTVTPV